MKSREYWKERYEQLENATHKKSLKTVKELEPIFDSTLIQVNDKINLWYQRIADNNSVSLAKAKKLLKDDELKEFHWSVKEYIRYGKENAINQKWLKELENASAKYHITKLEAQKTDIRQKIEELFNKEYKNVDKALKDGYKESFYRSCYELEKVFNIGKPITKLDNKTLDKIISKPWTTDGYNFSDRIWASKTDLIDTVHKELTRMYTLGEAPDKAVKNISKKFNASKSQASRLVQTEMSYFNALADKESYKRLGVEKVEIDATLDNITCGACGSLDGTVISLKDCEIGVNIPPYHPSCRCTTVPHFEDEFDSDERIARGNDGKQFYVSSRIKYNEWKEKYLVDNPNFVGPKSKGNYSEKEIITMAKQVKYMSDKYIEKPSKWSGNIQINNDLPSGKLWSCDITTRNNTSVHELLHEMLHSKSISYYGKDVYFDNMAFEEIPVQFLTQEISLKEGIELINSNYDRLVNNLKKFNELGKIEETNYLFAKKLFNVPVNERYKWLLKKANTQEMRNLIEEIKDDNLWKKKLKN